MNERLLAGLLGLSLSRPRIVIFVWVTALLALSPLAASLKISTSTDSVLNKEGESWEFYQTSLRLFDSDEVLVAALYSDVPFDREMLGRLASLSRELESLDGVRRVDSLATMPVIRARSDGEIEFAPAISSSAESLDSSDLAALVGSDPFVADSLLSRDGRVAALNVHLDASLGLRFDEIVGGVRSAVDRHGAWVSGVPVFRAEVNRRAGAEIGRFVVLTALVVAVVLYVGLGSFTGVLLVLLVGLAGTWAVLAALGGTGTPLTLVTVILPSIMLALGCAYSMHLVSAARRARSPAELKVALSEVMAPTALSGLTTSIGFVAIGSVQIDAVRQVGIFGAIGVLIVLFVSLSATPAALSLGAVASAESRAERWIQGRFASMLLALVERRRRMIILGSVFCVATLGVGLLKVEVATDVTQWFPRGSDVRESYEEIRARLSGISPMNVVIQSPDGSVTSPEMLVAIGALTDFLNGLPEVGKAISVVDVLQQLHAGFTGDETGSLPSSPELVAQYLLVLESAPYIADLITRDGSATTVTMRANDNGSGKLIDVARQAEAWWRENGLPGTDARATGIMYEFARAEDEIALGQLRGISFALAAIFCLMWVIFRSAPLALLAMVPNVLPLVAVFGALGLLGIPLDAGLVVSASLVLGIAVDNTIHLVAAVKRGTTAGSAWPVAVSGALRRVIVPVVLSTVAVGLGFLVLTGSGFAFVRNLGLLVVVVMVICCAADLLLLPAILRAIPDATVRKWGEMPSFKLA